MIRLINRETYLLPNNEIVQAVWRPESKIWVLYQSETERFWLVTRRGRIFHMRYGLNLAGYQDDLVDTGWNTSELALFEEPDISIMQAAQIQEVKPLYPHRLRNEPNPVRPYFGRAARRLIRALIFLQLYLLNNPGQVRQPTTKRRAQARWRGLRSGSPMMESGSPWQYDHICTDRN